MRRGFTLVELSIVLVILGLLIGGVLTGQSLIRAAELRSLSTQYSRYQTATMTFRDKYFALPGDMTNAQQYWGIAANCPGNSLQGSVDKTTCDGNGNGQMDVPTNSNEYFRYWQHLANAGLIEGSYSGVVASSGAFSTSIANAPKSSINSALWNIFYYGNQTGNGTNYFNGPYQHAYLVGRFSSNNFPSGSILKPEELYNIDTKIDDGKPAGGKIVVFAAGTIADCTDTSVVTNFNANYLLTSSTVACAVMFRQIF